MTVFRTTSPARFAAADSAEQAAAAAKEPPPNDADDSDDEPTTAAAVASSDEAAPAATASSQPSHESDDDADDEIPEWQNPLHHNDPDAKKIFKEDFGPDEEMPIVPLPPMNGEAPPHIQELADEILNLTMLEMKDLTDKVAEHFGFDDDVVVDEGVAEAGAAQAEEAEVKEEKTSFDLKLESFDAKAKIKVIKEVRAIAGLGLKEAKELVEGAPKVIKKDIKKEEAEELKKKLEEVGATIEIV
jgi:large subunit ribosomal protein L7/L12